MSCKIKIRNKNRFVKLGFQEQSKIRKNKRSIIGFQKNKEQYNNTIVGLGDRELGTKKEEQEHQNSKEEQKSTIKRELYIEQELTIVPAWNKQKIVSYMHQEQKNNK